jgi:secreted trypsin-like serine protease
MVGRLLAAACAVAVLAPAPADAVIGGSPAGAGDAPWAVALVNHRSRTARAGQFCAGSVIAPTVVLTAAHCVYARRPARVDVVSGRTRLSGTGGQRIRATRFALAPSWVPSTMRHDAALVTLAAPTLAPPIAIAGPANGPLVRPGADLLVTGWGRRNEEPGTGADDLQQATLTIAPEDECARPLRKFDPTIMLCAGSRGAIRATCKGDSGGGAIGFDGPTPLVVGLVSFGTRHCADGNPRAYARVPSEAGWVAPAAGLPLPAAPVQAAAEIVRAKCRPGRCAVDAVLRGDPSSVGGVAVRASGLAAPIEALPAGGRWRADFGAPVRVRRVSAQALDAAGDPLGPPARATVS